MTSFHISREGTVTELGTPVVRRTVNTRVDLVCVTCRRPFWGQSARLHCSDLCKRGPRGKGRR